jgi:hypothetical protein
MKRMRLFLAIFALSGIGLLAGGLYMARNTALFAGKAETAPGIVVENIWRESTSSRNSVSGSYYPRVRFRAANGREIEFISSTGTFPAAYRENEGVNVLYDPDDPQHAEIKGFWNLWLGPVIMLGLGVLFTGGVAIAIVWMRKQRLLHQWLRTNGLRIQANFERVELNTSLTVNGSHPYRIVGQWLNPRTNQVHVFHSDNLWFDPAPYVSGPTVDVWIDPEDPKRYMVDTAFLPQKAE